MKIAVYTNAYKPIISGVTNAIALFRAGLAARGHEVLILAPDYFGYRDQEPGVLRFPSVDLTRKVRFPVAIPWSPRLSGMVREFKPDVIHTHHPFVLGPVALRMARHLRVPLVYTFHTQYEQYAHYIPLPEGMVRSLTRRRIRDFVNAADAVTTPGDAVLSLLRSYGIEREIAVLPNPIDLSRFEHQEGETVRRQLGLAADDLVLISVGRIGVEKNLGFMLRACALMVKAAPELALKLVLVGAGPEERRLREQAAELGLTGSVIFAGSVPYQTVPSYLAAADLFLMTSVSEVKPLVLLEAMAAGLPVVAVRAAGAVDTVTHEREGLLTALDEEAFARAVVELARNETRRAEMGRCARESVSRYDLDKIAAELEEIYAGAIARLGGGRRAWSVTGSETV